MIPESAQNRGITPLARIVVNLRRGINAVLTKNVRDGAATHFITYVRQGALKACMALRAILRNHAQNQGGDFILSARSRRHRGDANNSTSARSAACAASVRCRALPAEP